MIVSTAIIRIVSNAVLFQIGWILSVLYGNKAALPIAVAMVVIYRLFFWRDARDWMLILPVIVLGWIGDSLLGASNTLVYPSGQFYPPFWLVTLWLLFACSLPWSLEWLVKKRLSFTLFSAVGGTLSYVVGVRLSDVVYGKEFSSVIVILLSLWIMHGIVIHELYRRWQIREMK